MLNIAVLVSGGGTNLQALLDSEARGENPSGKIRLVVASKPGVYALERAANAGVEGVVVRRKDYASSEDFDAALLKTLKEHNIDLVVLAGFSVGIVDKGDIIDPDRVRSGDVVLALPSSGLHSNGFSLVRKVFHVEHANLTVYCEDLGESLGEALLTPTRIYVKPVLAAIDAAEVHGISHITGGGFYENIPRCLPDGMTVKIEKAAVRTPPIFKMLRETGHIPERDMFNTFNMGVGMVLTVPAEQADKALEILHANGEPEAYRLGVIAEGEGVELC